MEDKMEKDVDKFLQAEESAEKLIQTLEKLQAEAKSYQGATNEIGIARDKLLELIGSTKDVVNNSYEVIKTLKDIGGPEIFERFNKIENKLNEGLKKTESKIEESSNQQSSRIKSLKFFVIITLLISLAIIAGLIFPNYLAELNNFFYNIFS